MKKIIFVFLMSVVVSGFSYAQEIEWVEGTVSFISSQNVYVKFSSTELLNKGDTLYSKQGEKLVPVLIIRSLSSISGVGEPINQPELNINDVIVGRIVKKKEEKPVKEVKIINTDTSRKETQQEVKTKEPKAVKPGKNKNFRGRLGANSYSGFSGNPSESFFRMRYVASFSAKNIGGSKFSAESYITFNHRDEQWSEIKKNINEGLKIYNMAVGYKTDKGTELYLGRKVNASVTNLGAMDGLQIRQKIKSLEFGVFGGTRPDYSDYGFNPDLLEYGFFTGHSGSNAKGFYQTSFALVEQKNKAVTDRRFLYLQHYNTLIKHLYTFISFEADLYQNINDTITNNLNLTGFYLMFRYRFTPKLRLSASYDVRNNVIYYETYKSYLDQLLENESRQGLNVRLYYRLSNKMNLGARGTYRFRKHDPAPSSNYSAYLSVRDLFMKGATTSFTLNHLSTSYLQGEIATVRFSHPLLNDKIYAGYQYRFFYGQYPKSELTTLQNNVTIDLNWMIANKLAMMFSYETQLESSILANRMYISLTKRF